MAKKFIGYFSDVDDIMDALEEAGAFEEEEGAEDEVHEEKKK